MKYHIATIRQANEVLHQFWPKPGWAYSLEHIEQFMACIGNPQDTLRVVHVAGTSGKTSTASFTAALLHAAGKKVGLLISPHITGINERVQIDLQPLSEHDFCQSLAKFLEVVDQTGSDLTNFEILYAFGYWEFARQQVDYAVVEVGVGGLLDATNVVHRADKVCVVTDIGFDHVRLLGRTLPEIAYQKAGIIQPGNTVFCYEQDAPIMEVIRMRCQQQGAELHIAPALSASVGHDLPLFQQRNFGLALHTVQYVLGQASEPLPDADALEHAAAIIIPARMEILHVHGKTVVLDGAHNSQKMAALRASLQTRFPDQPMAALFAFVVSMEKRVRATIAELSQMTQQVITTGYTPTSENPHRSFAPDTLAAMCREGGMTTTAEPDAQKALQLLLARPEPVLLITGSFYVVSQLRPILLAAD
jgi:dihydrofolate synthase/folylpolyglutamate synthase